jgi:two-component system sensor histidine kinase and response regulator WspE
MTSEGGLEDLTLIDLFRSEVETHSEVLSAALLALERSPGDKSRIDEMMRAAHSIKGAARVVGVDPAASVAHVMEDCFVAAQKGTLVLSPADVDVLLRGVDLLGKISEATRDPRADLANTFDEPMKSLVVELEAMLLPRDKPGGEPARSASGSFPKPPVVEVSGSSTIKPPAGTPTTTPGATTIAFPEVLDSAAAEEIRRRFLSAVEEGCDSVRIDLGTTKNLDVQGLVLLAAIPRHAAQHGRPSLRMARASAEMETVLRVTGLAEAYGLRPRPAIED